MAARVVDAAYTSLGTVTFSAPGEVTWTGRLTNRRVVVPLRDRGRAPRLVVSPTREAPRRLRDRVDSIIADAVLEGDVSGDQLVFVLGGPGTYVLATREVLKSCQTFLIPMDELSSRLPATVFHYPEDGEGEVSVPAPRPGRAPLHCSVQGARQGGAKGLVYALCPALERGIRATACGWEKLPASGEIKAIWHESFPVRIIVGRRVDRNAGVHVQGSVVPLGTAVFSPAQWRGDAQLLLPPPGTLDLEASKRPGAKLHLHPIEMPFEFEMTVDTANFRAAEVLLPKGTYQVSVYEGRRSEQFLAESR